MFLDQPAEVGYRDSRETLVFEGDQQLRPRISAPGQAFGAKLPQERGLAAAANADDRERLPRYFGHTSITASQRGRQCG